MKKIKMKGIVLLSIFAILLSVVSIALIGNTKAEGKVTTVDPGSGTLKKAVAAASEGDILKLKAGSYTGEVSDKTVEINKALTIEGVGDRTIIDVPLKIASTNGDKITLKGFASSSQPFEPNFMFIQVDSKVNLNVENIRLWGILRGSDGKYPRYESNSLDVTSKADGSAITIKNSYLDKPGTHYGINVNSSNTEVTIENTILSGRTAIKFENGSNNKFTVTDGSKIVGPSSIYTDDEAIIINKQDGLDFNVDNSTIEGSTISGNKAIKLFSFGTGENKSKNVKINIQNGSKVYDQDKTGSDNGTIFAFANDNQADDNNTITIDKTSKIYLSMIDNMYNETEQKDIPVDRKYSTLANSAVYGIYDIEGNCEIKLYDNDNQVSSLTDSKYVELNEYKFKGWFEDKDYKIEYEKHGDIYPNAKSGENKDLYVKLVKEVKVTIGDKPSHTIEEGQNLNDIKDIDKELEALKKSGQNLKGYIMHGATGGTMSYTAENLEELKKYPIIEDVKIEAIHNVTLTVNGKQFELDAGETVEEIGTHVDEMYKGTAEEYKNAKLNNREEKEFSRLVYKNADKTFDETSPINENTELETKHYAIVTIKDKDTEYFVEEGQKLTEDKDKTLLNALKSVANKSVEDKTFSRFEDSNNTKISIEEEKESLISKSTTITPVYTIEVKIGDKAYTLDEGQNLSILTDKQSEIKDALKKLVTDAGEMNFNGFIISVTNKEDKETILATSDSADSEINNTIMAKKLYKNTTIYAEYNAIVTINCPDEICNGSNNKKTFAINTGETLKTLLNNDDYQLAKYQKYNSSDDKEERFSRFVIDGTDNELKETDEIEKSITLTPKYYAYVTIKDDRDELNDKKYKVEQEKSIDDLVGKDAQETLNKLRTDIDIEPSIEEQYGCNLHFEKLIISGTNDDVPKKITDDIYVAGLYHYDVIIVEDYDNPVKDDGKEHTYGFKVYKDQTLNDHADKIMGALSNLEKSAEKEDKTRKFSSYWETNTNQEFTKEQESELLNHAFNRHIYITAKVKYKVEIGEKKDYVIEQHSLSEYKELEVALKSLEKSNKQLNKYTIDGVEITNNDEIRNTTITKPTKIGATYNVNVTIGESVYEIKDGATLGSLSQETQDKIKKELKALQVKEGFNFKGYNVGDDIDAVMGYHFNENTTITSKFNITITIDDNDPIESETGKTLKTESKINLDKIKNEYEKDETDPRVFSRFVDEDGNTFAEDTQFTKSVKLTTKYAYEITVDNETYKDKKYKVEVGSALDSNLELKNILDNLENIEGKSFNRFVDSNGDTILRKTDGVITKHTTIKPIYCVTINIAGREFIIDEGKTLGSYSSQDELTNYLDTLEKPSNKMFNKYIVDGEELEREELLAKTFNKNTTISVNYNVEIKIEGGEAVTIPFGSTINNDKLQEKIKNLNVPKNKSSIAYFTNSDNQRIDDNYKFESNMTITPKYNVKVAIKGVGDAEIVEGSKIFSATELVEKLTNNKEKDFKIFADGKSLDSIVNENITLTPLYTITVIVNGNKYTLDENQTLGNLGSVGYSKPENFKEFRDLEGHKIDESTPLTKHTEVVAIYTINISDENGDSLGILESGQSLSNLGEDALKALKINAEGRKFSRFVDQNGKTIKEDESLYENTTVIPKFNIKITVFRKDDEGKEIKDDTFEFELGEDLPIAGITEEENTKLQNWIEKVVKKLAEEGKENYVFTKFIDEEGNEIDLNNTKFSEDTRLEAIFEQKKEETPINPIQPEINENNNGNSNSYPVKEKAPNTAVKNQEIELKGIIYSILAILTFSSCGAIGYRKISLKKNK